MLSREQAIRLLLKELDHAEEKHPHWPVDRLRQAAIVTEEGGEVIRESLGIMEFEEKLVHDQWGRRRVSPYEIELDHHALEHLEEDLLKEVAQTGAMALRFLINYSPMYTKNHGQA